MKVSNCVLAAASLVAANFVLAQPEVVDRPVVGSVPVASETFLIDDVTTTDVSVATEPPAAQVNTGELYYQLQIMQQEILQLRGLVEEQSHHIKQLKQQRLDDYVDLDRRISGIGGQLGGSPALAGGSGSGTGAASRSNAGALPASPQSSTESLRTSSPANEIAHYKSATKLILVDKDYDAGISRLNEHLELYPRGRYAGNAQYWLGEVYLAKADLDASRKWFETLLQGSPQHAKAADAKYKLGTVYYQLGSSAQAKQLLQQAAAGQGNTAKLARDYLKSNF